MKQIKPSEISKTIAELLGWIHAPSTPDGYGYSWYDAQGNQQDLLDFEHDPRGTVMLIEWLISRGFNVATLNGNLLQFLKQTCNPVIHVIIPFKQVIGPAVARAFLRANGYEVSE